MGLAAALLSSLVLAAGPAWAQQVLLEVDSAANRVLLLSPDNGAVLNPFFINDANSATTYDFQTPRAAIQVGNEIWVSDQSPNVNAIYRFDLGGNYLSKIGGSAGGLNNVRGMRVIGDTVYVVNAGTGNGALRGLGTIDPNGVQDNSNFTLIQGNINGGWISLATIPEPPAFALLGAGLLGGCLLRRRVRQTQA